MKRWLSSRVRLAVTRLIELCDPSWLYDLSVAPSWLEQMRLAAPRVFWKGSLLVSLVSETALYSECHAQVLGDGDHF